MGAWRGEDTRGRVLQFLEPYHERLALVRVDAIGIGHNFGLHLRDHHYVVALVNVGQSCESRPEQRENDPAKRFVNRKAYFYQNLADAFERDEIEGLTDAVTISQLAGIMYEIDFSGRLKIESKERARERGVPSPDRAEALMLALCKPRPLFEYTTGRDLRRKEARENSVSRAQHPHWGFAEVAHLEDDDRPLRRRWPRGWNLF
jgi:hypothetical protein